MHSKFYPRLKSSLMAKSGLFFASVLGSSYTISYNKQESQEKLPLHYKKLKDTRAKWGKTALQGKDEASRELIARAQQIKEIYKDHYVFIHAQSTKLTPLTDLINAIVEKDGVPKSRFFKHIRKLENFSSTEVEKRILSTQKRGGEINDHDPSIRDIMISADGCFNSADNRFDNKEEQESANYFLKTNSSIFEDVRFLAQRILSDDSSRAKCLAGEIEKLSRSLEADCGNLFVFCIPKELFSKSINPDTIFYRSHPFGRKCDCPDAGRVGLLTDYCNYEVKPDYAIDFIPQFRLIIPSLTPDEGVLCFMLTPFEKSHRKQIKTEVKTLLESFLEDKKKGSEENSDVKQIESHRFSPSC